MENFYVYQDWTLELIPRCFYVGKGRKHRISLIKRNNKHTHIAKTYGIQRRIVMQLLGDEQGAYLIEKKYIAELHTYYKDPLCDKEIACNFTIGGGESSNRIGFKHSEEQKKKISESLKGRKFSEETNNKRSISLIKYYQNNISVNIGSKRSKETKLKMSKWQLGKKLSEETKKKISESRKGKASIKRKITFDQAEEIRELYYTGLFLQRELAEKYNTYSTNISEIINFKIYKR